MLKSDSSLILLRKFNTTVVIALLGVSLASCFSVKDDQAHLDEVKRLWSNFPLYEGMVEISSSQQSGFGKAYISKTFLCRAPYKAVKTFYVENLGHTGWQLRNEKDLKNWQGQVIGQQLTF